MKVYFKKKRQRTSSTMSVGIEILKKKNVLRQGKRTIKMAFKII